MVEAPKWYKISEVEPPITNVYSSEGYKYVLLGTKTHGPAIGFVTKYQDGEIHAVAGSFHGFEWTHWSPLPDGLPVEE
jgi:hypothetical protein